jgi:uncharacterized membrane protein
MTTAALFVAAGAFLASAVEMVEALTIVLAMGVSRGWRSTLIGAATALAALAVIIVFFGPLINQIPLSTLRIVIGGLLVIFGLQWLRKAILRASGFKALHDEEQVYRQELEAARAAGHESRAGLDWYAFTVSFKGVFLEGLEVAFIVLTFGAAHGDVRLAAIGAVAGLAVVGLAGIFIHQPLSRVPENTMKFCVGVLLTTFGVFWAGEGVNVEWPGDAAALLWILALIAIGSLGLVRWLESRHKAIPQLV